jgi:hypothetical protein
LLISQNLVWRWTESNCNGEDICESGFKKTPNLFIEKGVITDAEFKQKLLQERPGISTHSETDGAMKREAGPMSYRLKIIIFVLAINIMALAVGYLMRGLGLYWFIPVIFVMAWGAVLANRRWLRRTSS